MDNIILLPLVKDMATLCENLIITRRNTNPRKNFPDL